MIEPIPHTSSRTYRRKHILFIVAIIVIGIFIAWIAWPPVSSIIEAFGPRPTVWSEVYGSGMIPTTVASSTSTKFTGSWLKVGFSWWGENASVQNAVADVTVYQNGLALCSVRYIRPSENTVAGTCSVSGSSNQTFYLTVEIIGMVPNNNYDWSFKVYEQFYGPD